MDKKLSREELIIQLQAISTEGGTRELMSGAMCYCPAPHKISPRWYDKFTRKKIVWCNKCHRLIICDRDPNEIEELVKSIASMGYDVRVKSYCKKCCKKLKEELYPDIDDVIVIDKEHSIDISLEKRNHVFYYRTDCNEPYHRAIANDSLYYQYVQAFLQVVSKPRARIVIEDNFLSKQTFIIEYMTGIKMDEDPLLSILDF